MLRMSRPPIPAAAMTKVRFVGSSGVAPPMSKSSAMVTSPNDSGQPSAFRMAAPAWAAAHRLLQNLQIIDGDDRQANPFQVDSGTPGKDPARIVDGPGEYLTHNADRPVIRRTGQPNAHTLLQGNNIFGQIRLRGRRQGDDHLRPRSVGRIVLAGIEGHFPAGVATEQVEGRIVQRKRAEPGRYADGIRAGGGHPGARGSA